MSDSVVFGIAVTVLASAVLVVLWLVGSYLRRSRVHACRPHLPVEDRPPQGLGALRSSDIPREVDAGLAMFIGYLRRRTLQG